MVGGTRNLIAAAKEAGVRRLVLMSALGVTEQTKDLVPYYGAKWTMEQDVKASGLEHVIFRPSFVFGRDGGILPVFRKLAKLAPVTGIIGSGEQRIQPIWIDDVGAYFAARSTSPRRRTGRSRSAARTSSAGTSSGSGSARSSGSAVGRRCTCRPG